MTNVLLVLTALGLLFCVLAMAALLRQIGQHGAVAEVDHAGHIMCRSAPPGLVWAAVGPTR